MNTSDLLNKKIIHKKFGVGVVKAVCDVYFTVEFADGTYDFKLPDSFATNRMRVDDEDLQREILSEIDKMNKAAAARAEYLKLLAEEKKQKAPQKRKKSDIVDIRGFHIVNGVLKKYRGTAKHIVIPDCVTSIGRHAFIDDDYEYDTSDIKSVVIPGSVKKIESGAFLGCEDLKDVDIREGVESLGNNAFWDCRSLETLNIPKSVTDIGIELCGCHPCYLYNINVAEGNPRYHSAGNCLIETKTKKLLVGSNISVIPDDGSVTSIEDCAFFARTGLKKIKIPDCVTYIGPNAFSMCEELEEIVLPKNLNKIEVNHDIFGHNYELKKISMPADGKYYHCAGNCLIETASKKLIVGCSNSVIPDDGSVTSIEKGAFYATIVGLEKIEIPDCVTHIGPNAFWQCESLEEIVLPKNLNRIEIDFPTFEYCFALKKISMPAGGKYYHCAGNCLIETASKKLIAGCKNSVIPNDGSVTSIEKGAFSSCRFENFKIPSSIKHIKSGAFTHCSGIEHVPEDCILEENWNSSKW